MRQRFFRMKGQANNLTAAELKAIEEHKYYLSQQRGTEVSIEEAIEDFVQHFAEDWRQEKLRRDNLEQRDEIEKHKYLRSMAEGRDIGRSSAAGNGAKNMRTSGVRNVNRWNETASRKSL